MWRDGEIPPWALGLVGIGIGTAARYAMRLQDRLTITVREVLADVLFLGINGALTGYAITRLGTNGWGAVLTGALFAAGQGQIIRAVLPAFRRRMVKVLVAAGLIDASDAEKLGDGEEVAAPSPPPAPALPVVGEQIGSPDSDQVRAGNALHAAFDRATKAHTPEQITAALAALDDEPGAQLPDA